MDILIFIVISGLATAYLVELINSVAKYIASERILRQILTMPLNLGGLYLLGLWNTATFVAVPAASLISAIIFLLTNRPTVLRR
jgi:hypothetical protein